MADDVFGGYRSAGSLAAEGDAAPALAITLTASGEDAQVGPVKLGPDHFRCQATIVNEMGLHARPASLLVELANRYPCEVILRKDTEQVDGKSILQLLSLSAEGGSLLTIETRGPEAETAIGALTALIAAGFNET